ALGATPGAVWRSYLSKRPYFKKIAFGGQGHWVSKLATETGIDALLRSNRAYKNLDRTVLLALLASKKAMGATHGLHAKNVGVNIGSSRGTTSLLERYHIDFQHKGKVSPYASPTTTMGNISSWVAQELGLQGVQVDHSVTCSTAMHAILNGIAWLRANMADAFLVGGSEAALTPFTFAQMKALKLYTTSQNEMACESMRFQKKQNTMVLGEGAAVAVLQKGVSKNTKAVIAGYGFASERLEHNSSISKNAECFQKSMKRALENAKLKTVDVVVMHAPGTVKGDSAEKNAIDRVFGERPSLLTSNKWLVGHTFAASGMFSVEMAVMMLQHNKFIENPFFANARHLPRQLGTIMVNAVGFGGNAVSIILSKPKTG
ncbi:MAG: beta-ketoacyl synthase N-terminal-like domain-containing protein, partial [Marinirhabdus sp.]